MGPCTLAIADSYVYFADDVWCMLSVIDQLCNVPLCPQDEMVQRENVDRSEPETARKETTISTDPAKTDKEYKESFIDPFKDAYMSKYTVSTPSAALLAQTVLNNECTSDSSLIRVKIVYLKYYGIDANYSDREA